MKLTKKLSDFNNRYNIWLRFLAVVISVLLWLVVVNVSDPVITTTFSGVPVEVTGVEQLTADGKVYDLIGPESVTVTVSAKRSILDIISKDNLKAVADLKNINEDTGLIPLKVESSKYNEKIESMKAKEEAVQVGIDELMRKQLPIAAVVQGVPAEGCVVGDVTMDQNIVRLSGPEAIVSQVAKVQAEVSVEGMSSNISTTVELRYYDEDDNPVSKADITSNISSVALVTDILAAKTVPVRVAIAGEPADGYGLTGEVKIKPSEVYVAGRNSVMKKVNEIVIPAEAVPIIDEKSDVRYTLDLTEFLPEGVRLADAEQSTKLKINIGIAQKDEKDLAISKSMITIANVPEGFEAELSMDSALGLTFTGMPDVISTFGIEDVKASIDMKAYMQEKGIGELATATYGVPIKFTLPEGITVKGDESISVNVRVKKLNNKEV